MRFKRSDLIGIAVAAAVPAILSYVLMAGWDLLHHEGTPEYADEGREAHLREHLRWAPAFAERVVRQSVDAGFVKRQGELLELTESGRDAARGAMAAG